jgi:hypothetical protein
MDFCALTVVYDTRSFEMAPMSHVIRLVTGLLMVLPVAVVMGGVAGGGQVMGYSLGVAGAIVAIYAFVYLRMRPSRFEVEGSELRIVFPLRTLSIDLDDVVRAGPITFEIFKQRYPRPIRMGAGGLFGGFGMLMTQNGRVQFYVSRDEPLVLLEFESGRMPVLISPSNPDEFLATIDCES